MPKIRAKYIISIFFLAFFATYHGSCSEFGIVFNEEEAIGFWQSISEMIAKEEKLNNLITPENGKTVMDLINKFEVRINKTKSLKEGKHKATSSNNNNNKYDAITTIEKIKQNINQKSLLQKYEEFKPFFLLRALFEFFDSFIDVIEEKKKQNIVDKEKSLNPFWSDQSESKQLKEKIADNIKALQSSVHGVKHFLLSNEFTKFEKHDIKDKFRFRIDRSNGFQIRSLHNSFNIPIQFQMKMNSLHNDLDIPIKFENMNDKWEIIDTTEVKAGGTLFWTFGKHFPLRIQIPNKQYFAFFQKETDFVHLSNFQYYGNYERNEYEWKDDLQESMRNYSVRIKKENGRIYFELDLFNRVGSNDFEFKIAGLNV